MPQKKYVVRLTDEERSLCEDTRKRVSAASQKARRAHILLLADADGPDAWIDAEIAKTCRCRTATVENVRRRCVLEGFERALDGKQRENPPVPKLLNGRQEAEIIALRLGPPPEGYAHWSLRLLARCVVELGIVESISHETVAKTLKKTAFAAASSSTGSSRPRPTPSSPRPWKGCCKPMPGRTMRNTRCCAWTSSRCSWCAKSARRWRPRPSIRGESTTSTSGPARRRSSCSPSPWRAGAG